MRAALLAFVLSAALGAAAASPERGKTAFVKHGCWQCHGYEGQGGIAGAKLAPGPLALDAMSAFVRNTRGAMPPYSKALLPDDDLADIHAYLAALPKGRDPRSIRELDPVSPSSR